MLPCVSQGAAPLGRELTITAAEDNIIHELAGRPALETIEQVIGELTPRERALIAGGPADRGRDRRGRPEYEQGDFLVRGVLGADRDTGAVAIGAAVQPGQVVRLHARDARSADEDLRRELRAAERHRRPAARRGAACSPATGAGSEMFGAATTTLARSRTSSAARRRPGFFAAGEIGPVGGRSFLHGFTATVAVFPR